MPDPAERLVNLALYLASSRSYVTAEQCRFAGLGYPEEQDTAAFLRMFERDKDALRAAGMVIEVKKAEEVEAYRLDADATFARPVELDPGEIATVRTLAAALADDPAFPFGEDLALALGKLGIAGEAGPLATAELAGDAADTQGTYARALAEAVQTRKRVTFEYTNAAGETKHHAVDPYGVFFREGNWYFVGRDRDLDEIRTYTIGRIRELDVNSARPHTPDFERPSTFDIRQQERLPFQYGASAVTGKIRFEPDVAWRAARLARGHGQLETMPDGSVAWTVDVLDIGRLARWLVDEGPGVQAVAPEELVEAVRRGLRAVVESHA